MIIKLIKNNKINIDLDSINVQNVEIKVYNLDTDCHKDLIAAKKILYKWGNPSLPFCVICDGKVDKVVLYNENEEITTKTILAYVEKLQKTNS